MCEKKGIHIENQKCFHIYMCVYMRCVELVRECACNTDQPQIPTKQLNIEQTKCEKEPKENNKKNKIDNHHTLTNICVCAYTCTSIHNNSVDICSEPCVYMWCNCVTSSSSLVPSAIQCSIVHFSFYIHQLIVFRCYAIDIYLISQLSSFIFF